MDTSQRAALFTMLRRMESDTVRMYDAALPKSGDGAGESLREMRQAHERHVGVLEVLLGACRTAGEETPSEVLDSLEQHVLEVREAGGEDEALRKLLEAEQTLAAEYAVAEEARLAGDEPQAIHRLHGDQRDLVGALRSRLA